MNIIINDPLMGITSTSTDSKLCTITNFHQVSQY